MFLHIHTMMLTAVPSILIVIYYDLACDFTYKLIVMVLVIAPVSLL